MEVVLIWCAIAGRIEWGDESVAAVGSALRRVQVALVSRRLAIRTEYEEGARQDGSSYQNFTIMHLRSDSCDACWVLLSKIFCCRSFASIFTDERDTHVLLERQAVALLYVDVRIIASLLSYDESEPLLHVEILSFCKLCRL